MLEKNLIRANEDIVTVSAIAKSMGWGAVSEQSFYIFRSIPVHFPVAY